MTIRFNIDYRASWGQTVCICGSIPELGNWDEKNALRLDCYNYSKWTNEIKIENPPADISYYYLIKDGDAIVRKEWGDPHTLNIDDKTFLVSDFWQDIPAQQFLYTSPFSESFFAHKINDKISFFDKTIYLKVNCPYVKKDQILVLCGESDLLGNWNPQQALTLKPETSRIWQITIDASSMKTPLACKLAIYDSSKKQVVHWEYGDNRSLAPFSSDMKKNTVKVINTDYRYGWVNWKVAGVAIPVFSIRSKDSFGVGEFSDLKKMIDWAVETEQKIIQVLPINDTTLTHRWTDSYPYNAISIYALHPMYLGLKDYPLSDKKLFKQYTEQGEQLNALKAIDYEKVIALKNNYVKDLYAEKGQKTLKSKKYKEFFKANEEWLFPYACFCYFRDKYKTPDYSTWENAGTYDADKLSLFMKDDAGMQEAVNQIYFFQYLLHEQLLEVKKYAHSKGIILKGDIPIGISRNSVEAWVEPHLFNMDTQTGAPPDDFSVSGQNWGFPTYNWDEMAKDNYRWWSKRFHKMSDYFDAYRIDHILGFFRIWEIPLHSVQGLLGYFSPALPYTVDEIRNRGMWFDEYRMTMPYIHEHFMPQFFGEYAQEVMETYLNPISWQRFELKEFCNTQIKIKLLFEGKEDVKSMRIRNGLYGLCNEVLFIRDKKEPDKFHPRITAQYTFSFNDLDGGAKAAFNGLYDEFFYRRHTQFWKEQALNKLPTLISSTNMLVCGEDLGMIPSSVPDVMRQLQILSLEIQRMPKDSNTLFENLNVIPYLSVCTTSTHDMPPVRAWWRESKDLRQKYYNDVLWKPGLAPDDCTPELCHQILNIHVKSPAMLVILPLQDWLSMDGDIRNKNPEEERINIPSNPQHYWRYRMHINIEELIENNSFNTRIKEMLQNSGRIL